VSGRFRKTDLNVSKYLKRGCRMNRSLQIRVAPVRPRCSVRHTLPSSMNRANRSQRRSISRSVRQPSTSVRAGIAALAAKLRARPQVAHRPGAPALPVDAAFDLEDRVDALDRFERDRRDGRRVLPTPSIPRDLREHEELPPRVRPTQSCGDRSSSVRGVVELVVAAVGSACRMPLKP